MLQSALRPKTHVGAWRSPARSKENKGVATRLAATPELTGDELKY